MLFEYWQSAEGNSELNRRITVYIVTVCERLFKDYLHKAVGKIYLLKTNNVADWKSIAFLSHFDPSPVPKKTFHLKQFLFKWKFSVYTFIMSVNYEFLAW